MAGVLAERQKVISALYPEIEELVDKEILLQAPVASDLRFLLAVSRIVPEIELSHNLVVQIASRADHYLSQDPRRAAAGWSSAWGTSYPTCGARPRTPGTGATVPPRLC